MTLDQYIKAIQNQANGAQYVQLRKSDGSLTQPMSVNAAAEYLYGGTRPQTKTMPSEQIAQKQDYAYSANVAKKAAEAQRAKENDANMRNFYMHGVLPATTFGISELFTNGDPKSMSLAQAAGLGLRSSTRAFWPLALGAGAWSWYTATHEPPSLNLSYGTRVYDQVPTDSVTPANPTPVDTTNTVTPSATPEPERNDSTSNRSTNRNQKPHNKPSFKKLLWETKTNSPNSTAVGRQMRNWGLRIPIYGTVANWGIPTVGNTVSFINTGKTPIKWPLTSYIPGVFPDSVPDQSKKLVPVQINGRTYYIDPSQDTQSSLQTQQVDSNYVAPDQTVNLTDTLDF